MRTSQTLKAREYGTDILAHQAEQTGQRSVSRQSKTFQSQVLGTQNFPEPAKHVSRERYNPKKTLVGSVTRTSFQDSNIFGYKSTSNLTT
jgi:hypothetical protein